MKFTSIILVFLISNTFLLHAQTAQETPAERKAIDLLGKASQKIKAYSTMEVEFSYVMENSEMGIEERMSGTIYSSGDKYRMILGDNIFISDGVTVWNYIDDMYEIHINTVENAEGGLTPTALLENFETEYRGKFIRQESHNGRMVDLIDLVPNTPQAFFKYRVAIDASDQSLVYTIAYDRHGGTYTYNIDDLTANTQIPASHFTFNREDFPENADVVDFR